MSKVIKLVVAICTMATLFFTYSVAIPSQIACVAAASDETPTAGHRFGIDENLTKQVADTEKESQLPFEELWQIPLGGTVQSQPIIIDEPDLGIRAIFVQAGKHFYKIPFDERAKDEDLKGEYIANITGIEITQTDPANISSASAPTFAVTQFGPRIYQATKDHKLYAIDPISMEKIWVTDLTIGNRTDLRYRITASPKVEEFEVNGRTKTLITLGTAFGDLSGKTSEYFADNAFYAIEDKGSTVVFSKAVRQDGEVTGSHIEHNGIIYGTVNTQNKKSSILKYVMSQNVLGFSYFQFDHGLPTSLALENDALYAVDRAGVSYKLNATTLSPIWKNNHALSNSLVLEDPTVGNRHVFANIKQASNIQEVVV